ncbi:energy transducer TonB, partial [bacterium]|nr:energy transducer TonB [bacterium]
QVAAIFHAGIVAILAAASFWYSDAMTLPAQSLPITGVFFESVPTPPAQRGIEKHSTVEKPAMNNSKPVQEIIQQSVVPEGPDFVQPSTQFTDLNNLGDLPEGDPKGVDGGLQNGSGNGGFGSGGNGIGIDGPIKPEDFIKLRVEQPVVIQKIDPIYPPTLLRMHKEGIVVLQALITRIGDVQKIEILKSDHPLFSQSAINAVSQWKYRAAQLRGKPVAVYFTVTVMFRIK